ncbi:MAG: DUF599 domain-containing protein [Hyphomicrobiales bacterium]
MALPPEVTEVGLNTISFGLLLVYHLRLYQQVRQNPLTTAIGLTNHARRAWVQSIIGEKRDILAIQTFRNWVMASTFLASTAILICLGLVASAFRTEITSSATHALNVFGHPSETLWVIKLLLLSALFFYAFFNFTLSIRYYNHASLLINVPHELEPSSSADSVSLVLNHGALHYTLGMRGFYLAIPLGLWLFGPFWMLGGSILTVIVLYRLDREV